MITKTLMALSRDTSGNFAILSSLLLPVLLGTVALSIDTTTLLARKTQLQAAADSAALAASAALGNEQISTQAQGESLAKQFVAGLMPQGGVYTATAKVLSSAGSNGATKWDVAVKLEQTVTLTPFASAIGWKSQKVSVSSSSTSSSGVKNALSMYFVLDKSGSMQVSTNELKNNGSCNYYWMSDSTTVKSKMQSPCYNQRIESLKNAVNSVFQIFDKADPTNIYFRTGADAYDSSAKAESKLAWGNSAVKTYVNNLAASGGTSSTGAFKAAFNALTNSQETAAHIAKTGITPKKYIVFMTDGENSSSSDDTATLSLCSQAKGAGIIVYAVAFYAPPVGKKLLSSCASSANTYFDASNGTQLQEAFGQIGQMTSGEVSRLTQ